VEQLQAANADLGKRLDDTRRALTDSEASVARLVAAEAAVARLTQELDAQRAATQETADKLKEKQKLTAILQKTTQSKPS
jgi:hypothetical protein